ncbi:MAG: permease-like cell division protein FtsX [Acutalibacteraceae bacterium]|nr:permease-like cell division protein FtsX [Acutalibacteraceae bacterium]
MKLSSIKYLTGEGIKNAWVNRLMTLASVGVLVACMVIIGLAILISENVNVAIGNLEQQNVVMVYMKDYNWALYSDKEDTSSTESASSDTSSAEEGADSSSAESTAEEADKNGIKPSDYVIHDEKEAKALCDEIAKISNVAEVTYISSNEGLETVKESMPEDQRKYFTFLDEEYGNPLPSAAKVTMKDMALFDKTIKQIEKLDGIDTIQSYGDLAEKITAVKNGIGVAGVWIIAILMIISLVIVSNTIRVTMYNRKLEISIMKAVGATDTFVRIPFVVEGVLIGIISALISEGLLYFCYRVATETIITTLGTSDIVKYSDMAWILLLVFLGIGVFAGILGSFIMISKYLRREGSEFAAI